jgi:predicted AlkP superfamily phosphohydrolase/phosphomutase
MAKRKKRLKHPILFSIIILIIIAIVISQFWGKDVRMESDKVLLIGIDGMDPKITNSLIEKGVLPNFQKLKEKGYYSELSTSYPPHSPVAWASIATGSNPGKHNIFDFIRRDPNTYMPELSLAKTKSGIGGTDYVSYVKADPFWKITTEADIPTTVIRWPLTFPPERVEGNLLSGLGVPDVKGFLSGYTFYNEKENSEKSIKIQKENNRINTVIKGPKIRKGSDIVDVTTPMQITIADKVTITVDEKDYPVDGWSDWIQVKFKISAFKSVRGIFKAYIVSKDPFEMYITTIQFDPENPIADISYPKDYSDKLAKEIGLYYTLGMPEETDGYVDGKISKTVFLEQVKGIESERDKMFWKEFDSFKGGIYAFVYDSSDRIQHVTWDSNNISDSIEQYYIEKDKFLGEVLAKIKGKEVALFVFSDHGFTDFDRAVSMNRWLVENNFMTLKKDDGEAPLFRNVTFIP